MENRYSWKALNQITYIFSNFTPVKINDNLWRPRESGGGGGGSGRDAHMKRVGDARQKI